MLPFKAEIGKGTKCSRGGFVVIGPSEVPKLGFNVYIDAGFVMIGDVGDNTVIGAMREDLLSISN